MLASISSLFFSCSVQDQKVGRITEKGVEEIYFTTVLKDQPACLIYGWTTWCTPCVKTIKDVLPSVKKTLDSLNLNVGLVAICGSDYSAKGFSKLNDYMEDMSIASYFLKKANFSLHDRWALNGFFDDALKGYEPSSGVPIILVVDKNGNVLSQDRWVIASRKRLIEALEGIEAE